MKISEVEIAFIKPQNGLVGFASFVLDQNVYLSNIAIHKKLNSDGYRLTYPSKGQFTIFHPINKDCSLQIEMAIFQQLKKVMNKAENKCLKNMTID